MVARISKLSKSGAEEREIEGERERDGLAKGRGQRKEKRGLYLFYLQVGSTIIIKKSHFLGRKPYIPFCPKINLSLFENGAKPQNTFL